MAGLLGEGWDDPKSAAIMALAGGLLRKDFGGGLLGANQAFADHRTNAAKKQYMDMQMQNMQSEIEARKLKTIQDQRKQEFDAQFFGMGGPAGVSPATATAGGPPGAAASAGGFTAQQISQQFGVPIEAVIADYRFNGGKKIAELIDSRAKPNWTNVNGNLVNTNAPGFQGGLQAGMSAGRDGQVTAWQPDGRGGVTVGAPQGAFETFGRYKGIEEGAKAGHALERVYNPETQREEFRPRSQVLSAAQPRASTSEASLRPMVQGGMGADPASIRHEIAQATASLPFVKDPASRQLLEAHIADMQRQGAALPKPMAAGPSAGEVADAAGAKTRAEADARAASERQTGFTKKGDQAKDMLGNIQRARTLLEMDPTGSLVGAGVDKVLGALGGSTASGNNATALETIAGWLTVNTPRMEGPQSNLDQELYRTMAGKVGDRTTPVADRKAALAEVERIQKKYAHLNGNTAAPEQKTSGVIDSLPKTAAKGTRARDTVTGEIFQFNGMSWVKAK